MPSINLCKLFYTYSMQVLCKFTLLFEKVMYSVVLV